MHPITTPSGTYLCVGVPEDAHEISVFGEVFNNWLYYRANNKPNTIKLSSNDAFSIIGEIKVDSMDDECTEMIESWDEATGGDDYQDYYKNYEIQTDADYEFAFHFTEPEQSVRSLLTYNKIEIKEGEKLLIIKKV